MLRGRRGQTHSPSDHPEADHIPCCVTLVTTPATPAQLAAWRQLWARLLGHVDPTQEVLRPQELSPGAVDCATASGGHHLLSEIPNDIGNNPRSK